jgi:hypothetical protein
MQVIACTHLPLCSVVRPTDPRFGGTAPAPAEPTLAGASMKSRDYEVFQRGTTRCVIRRPLVAATVDAPHPMIIPTAVLPLLGPTPDESFARSLVASPMPATYGDSHCNH